MPGTDRTQREKPPNGAVGPAAPWAGWTSMAGTTIGLGLGLAAVNGALPQRAGLPAATLLAVASAAVGGIAIVRGADTTWRAFIGFTGGLVVAAGFALILLSSMAKG